MTESRDRRPEPAPGPEKEMLLGFLQYERDTFVWKLEGLDDEQTRRTHPPSSLTLLGLVKHLTTVEQTWFQARFAGDDGMDPWASGDPEGQWGIEPGETLTSLLGAYRAACEASDRIVLDHALDDVGARPTEKRGPLMLRWILVHMIQETARHVGHADLLREAIDGRTGT